MEVTDDWFTPEQIQKEKPQFTLPKILEFLNKVSRFRFFQIVNIAFEKGYPKFKRTVEFSSPLSTKSVEQP